MSTRLERWRLPGLVLIVLVLLGCASLGSTQPTRISPSSGGGNGSGSGSGDSNNNPGPNNSTTIPTLQDTATPTVTPAPDAAGGPYLVRQTQTLGKEKLGSPPDGVCVNVPWQVPVDSPEVSFEFVFGGYSDHPGSAGNTFGYAYQIPSAGESHEAHGRYTLSLNKDGTIKVSISGSDHVVFKGFDGPIPVHYTFDLVPMSGNATCP